MEPRNQRGHLERHPRLVAGVPVPLFDRFDEDLDDSRILEPYRIQSLELLLESIQKEVENLLNTRLPPRQRPVTSWEPISEPQTVLDYGLPAFSPLGSGRATDSRLLKQTILRKIASFEPRLIDPQLELHSDPDDPAGMLGTLRGKVRLDNMNQPVCFPVSLRDHGESATILPAEAD
ncbi:type VI secretion system lysozyme-like protein [Silvibacterium bohemicum]|uniref:Type VI secretion system lysozyme-like protein n=1 Tax=Silvibacterium bohemicum TaxID=1577686 RepID=A0A841JQI1_9BACT|nr:type VI secretion system baseplate subunit TssE [Silvibacterium bohemicum]MBB6143623.1 type VI secretion system lysozyme-like protein [Silvibacterium bohemicum]